MKTAAKAKKVARENREFMDTAAEVSVFMACFGLMAEASGLSRKASLVRPEVYAREMFALMRQLSEAAESTIRFSIVRPVEGFGTFSVFFWRWFNWWNDYVKSLNPDEVTELLRAVRDRDQAYLDSHRPAGDWLDYRKDPLFQMSTN